MVCKLFEVFLFRIVSGEEKDLSRAAEPRWEREVCRS